MEEVWVMSPELFTALQQAGKIEYKEHHPQYMGKTVFVDARIVGMKLVNVDDTKKKEGVSHKWL